MVQDLSSCMTIALDEIAPIKLKDAWVLPSFGFAKVASISRQLLIASVARWIPPDGDINPLMGLYHKRREQKTCNCFQNSSWRKKNLLAANDRTKKKGKTRLVYIKRQKFQKVSTVKKYSPVRMGGWMEVKAGLRTAPAY